MLVRLIGLAALVWTVVAIVVALERYAPTHG